MRDLKDLTTHIADELAGDAFDAPTPGVEQWVKDALVGEWGNDAQKDAEHLIWASIRFYRAMYDMEAAGVYRRAVEQLRERYIDWASQHATYAAEAWQDACSYQADMAEQQRDYEADAAALRG